MPGIQRKHSQLAQCLVNVGNGRNLSKVQANGFAGMAGRALRARDEVDRLVMPFIGEGTGGVLNQANAEEAIDGLDSGGEDADIGKNAC